MELEDQSQVARVAKTGRETYSLTAADEVKLRIAEIDELEIAVPSGKVWFVTVNIDIIETDA